MVSKTALDLGLKGVTVESVERRIDQLVQNRQIVMGTAHATDRDGKMVTTQEALRIEEKILDLVKEGNGAANPVLSAADAPAPRNPAPGGGQSKGLQGATEDDAMTASAPLVFNIISAIPAPLRNAAQVPSTV